MYARITGLPDPGAELNTIADAANAPRQNVIYADPTDHFFNVWKNPGHTAALSVNFSPYYMPGADPETGSPVSEDDMRRALDAIAPFADTIRTFGVSGEMNKLYKIGKLEYNYRIYAGCWIGSNYEPQLVRNELETLAEIGNLGYADILIVGSEGLLRGDYNAKDLIGWLNDLRGLLHKDIPIGVSETAASLLGYPEVVGAADVAMFTLYPYFNNTPVDEAVGEFERVYRLLQKAAGHTKLICSETGWKFESDEKSAQAGPENGARYLEDIYAFSQAENLEICIFEALAEDWKARYDDDGWNLLDADLVPRPAVSEMLERISESVRLQKHDD